MITRADAMQYLGIEEEYADDAEKRRVDAALSVAARWIRGAVGQDVDMDDQRAEELMLMAVGECFGFDRLTDTRMTQKIYASLNRLAGDLVLQLKYLPTDALCDIRTYSISGATLALDYASRAVTGTVPSGTSRSALVATFALSKGATAKVGDTEQVSGTTANDFTGAVTYVVTSADEAHTAEWTVTIAEAEEDA